jgi:hypothetical protein
MVGNVRSTSGHSNVLLVDEQYWQWIKDAVRQDYGLLACQWLKHWIKRLDQCNIEQGGLIRSDNFASFRFHIWDTRA